MNNAEKFKQIFGLYATELWSMPESDFLAWLNRDVETTQIGHTADIGKKVSISCGRENDLISRQEALKELAAYIHLIDKTMGKGTLTDDDCMEAAKSVLGKDEIPAVQPEIIRCKDCKYRYLDGMIWNCPFGLSGGEDFFCAYGAIGGGSGT